MLVFLTAYSSCARKLRLRDSGFFYSSLLRRIRLQIFYRNRDGTSNLVRPKEHIELLRPLIADRYAPLQPNGNGIQSVYLTVVSEGFAEALIALIGPEAIAVQANAIQADRSMTVPNADLELWEHHIESEVDQDISIPLTDREAIITARRRQGLFKQRVMAI